MVFDALEQTKKHDFQSAYRLFQVNLDLVKQVNDDR